MYDGGGMGGSVTMYFIVQRPTLWVRSFATKAEHEYEDNKLSNA